MTEAPRSQPQFQSRDIVPDDFVSPMNAAPHTLNREVTPPMNPSAFQPLDQTMFPPSTEYQGAGYQGVAHHDPEYLAVGAQYHEPENHDPEYQRAGYQGVAHHDPEYPVVGAQYHGIEHPEPEYHEPQYHEPEYHEPEYHETQYQGPEYQPISDRMRENAAVSVPEPHYYYPPPPGINEEGLPLVSEIDDFAHNFHTALAQMSPPTPPQPQLSNIELPPLRDASSRSTLGMEITDGYAQAEDKETGAAAPQQAPIIRKTVGGFRSENVRKEGWQPHGLRAARSESPEREGEGTTPRYQLVDQPPSEGVRVLEGPGQLRAKQNRSKPSS